MGMEMAAAPIVTNMEPRIKGRIPKSGGSEMGYQFLPKRNWLGVIILKSARPSFKRNKKIRITKNMDANPQRKINFSIKNSLIFLILYHLFNRHKVRLKNDILPLFGKRKIDKFFNQALGF